jgi:hypothetical protein
MEIDIRLCGAQAVINFGPPGLKLKGALQSVCKQSLCLHFCVQNIELYSTTIYIFKLLEYNK